MFNNQQPEKLRIEDSIWNLLSVEFYFICGEKLDLELIKSGLRMDFEKEGISIRIAWDLKILWTRMHLEKEEI